MKKFNKDLLSSKSASPTSIRDLKVGDMVRLTTRSHRVIETYITGVSESTINYRRPDISQAIDNITIDIDYYYRDKSHVVKIEKI